MAVDPHNIGIQMKQKELTVRQLWWSQIEKKHGF